LRKAVPVRLSIRAFGVFRGHRRKSNPVTTPRTTPAAPSMRPCRTWTQDTALSSSITSSASSIISGCFPNLCFINSMIGGRSERKTTTMTTFSMWSSSLIPRAASITPPRK